jgi:hypothetical protein
MHPNDTFNDLESAIISEIYQMKHTDKRDYSLDIDQDYEENVFCAFTVRCLRYQSINNRFEHKTYSADAMQLLFLCNI